MLPGRPSVDLVRQLVHICGTSCTHHRTVPMVPRTLAATGMDDCGAIGGAECLCMFVFWMMREFPAFWASLASVSRTPVKSSEEVGTE